MTDQPSILARAHYRELRNARYDLAVLPWGATEPHNLHLPYGTDNMETEMIAAKAATIASTRGARVIVLPTVPFGVNTTQLDIPMTISIYPSTQMALLHDIASSLEGHGIPKLLILNGHGGNDFKQMIRELQTRHSIFLCSANWWVSINAKDYFDEPGDHAGELETSLMMYLAPDSVLSLSEAGPGKERKPKIRGFRDGWAWAPRPWTTITDDTGVGNPGASAKGKGERYFAAVTETIGTFLADLAAADLKSMFE
jgi:creatinine amidohydrolase